MECPIRSGDNVVTSSARSIIQSLVDRGVIPPEFTEEATAELHRELSRRARRISQTLAVMASMHTFGRRAALIQG